MADTIYYGLNFSNIISANDTALMKDSANYKSQKKVTKENEHTHTLNSKKTGYMLV